MMSYHLDCEWCNNVARLEVSFTSRKEPDTDLAGTYTDTVADAVLRAYMSIGRVEAS
jgi:hypothetical protein